MRLLQVQVESKKMGRRQQVPVDFMWQKVEKAGAFKSESKKANRVN